MNFNIISIIRASYDYSELKKGRKTERENTEGRNSSSRILFPL